MRIRASITIDRPPDQVFPWVEDPDRAMEWQTQVTGGQIVEEAPGWVGTTFTETITESGRSTELRGTVTAFAKDHYMGFHLEGDHNEVDVLFALEGRDGGLGSPSRQRCNSRASCGWRDGSWARS